MVSINLIPSKILQAQAMRIRLMRWSISFGGAMLVLLTCAAVDVAHRAEASELATHHVLLQGEIELIRTELRATTASLRQVQLQTERAGALRAKRAWSSLLTLIGDCLPKRCWLTSIATDPKRPQAQRATSRNAQEADGSMMIVAPRKLKLIGYAGDAGEPHTFVTSLKATGAFSDVTLDRSQREPVGDEYGFRFELTCEW